MKLEVSIEQSAYDLDELFVRIDELQDQLATKCSVNWHDYSYFYYPDGGSFWRFDWEYIWNDADPDLEALLHKAIKAGEAWLA